MLLKKLLTALACLFTVHSFSQNNVQQFIFENIAEKDGLSNNIINCIAKDKEGFLWIGTFDGLNRFDGTHFITFRNDRHNPNSLLTNTVHGICCDNNGDIWCTASTGISCYHRKTQSFENFFPETKKSGLLYLDIVCDAWGTIWCSSSNGIYEYVPASKTFRQYGQNTSKENSLTSNGIYKRGLILSPDKRSLWISTGNGINHFDIASKKIYNYRNNPQKLAVFDSASNYPLTFDRTGKLIYGEEHPDLIKQYDFTSDKVTTLDILFSKRTGTIGPADCIFIDDKNRYWISTWAYTLFMYDPKENKVQEFFHDDKFRFSVGADYFWDAYQDEEGTLWLGTLGGLSYANPDIMVYKLHQPFKSSDSAMTNIAISRFFEDDKKRWWFTCMYQSTLYQYDPSTGITNSFKWPFKEKHPGEAGIRGLNQYKNQLLINTESGIYSFDMNTHHYEEAPVAVLKKMVGGRTVYSMKVIHDSILCLLAEQAGIIQYSLNTGAVKKITLQENEFLKDNIDYYRASVISANDKWYFAFGQLKLACYDVLLNKLDTLPLPLDEQTITGNDAVNIAEDMHGILWLSLKGTGLVRYDPLKKTARLWQQSEGLAFNHIYGIVTDGDGKVWTAGYNKLSVFDPSKNSFQNFSLPVSENSYGYSSRLINLQNGNILGNIAKTFVEWQPEQLGSDTTRLSVLINAFRVFDSTRPMTGNNIELKHDENFFSIEFGILTGLEKSRYHLQYMLAGFNDKWIDGAQLNTATYTNIPEKHFIFKVRAIANDNSWHGKETTLGITVIPPYYRTAWFRILAALVFAAFIGWIIRLRINNIRKSEQQKNEFNKVATEWRLKALRSQMNPHFIFNCMNSIDLYILKNDAENASRYLNKFAKLVRLILNQSDEINIPLGKEIEMLKYYIELEALRFDTPFKHSIKVDDAIDPDETQLPSMLIQPYVENAILHGLRHKKSQGQLTVSIQQNKNGLHCIIEDDGVGRVAASVINANRINKHQSKGIKLTEERLQMIDAQQNHKTVVNIFDLADDAGNATGTRVEIEVAVELDD